MEVNFESLEMQKLNIATDRDQKGDEDNGVICQVIMFFPKVMAIKMSKIAHFFNFMLMTAKHLSQFPQNI